MHIPTVLVSDAALCHDAALRLNTTMILAIHNTLCNMCSSPVLELRFPQERCGAHPRIRVPQRVSELQCTPRVPREAISDDVILHATEISQFW